MTHAILNDERALLLAPGDADIRFNLQLARSKTVDKIVPQSELFVTTWYRSVVNLLGIDGWTETAIVSLGLAVVLFLIYLFCSPLWLRKVGFFGSALLMVAFVLANIFAWQQKQILERHDGAIIMDAAVPVKSTPSQSGTDLFILHEGTKVQVLDSSIGDWCEVSVPDGKQGWVETSQIEII